VLNDHSLHRVLGRHEQAPAPVPSIGNIVEPALGQHQAAPASFNQLAVSGCTSPYLPISLGGGEWSSTAVRWGLSMMVFDSADARQGRQRAAASGRP